MDDNNPITYFAEIDRRNKRTPFGIKSLDRTRHVYIIGKTGMGKSTLLENMAVQDIRNGNGIAFMDPHGKTADLLLDYVPEDRIDDVVYFAPFDLDNPISFNILENVDPEKRHLVASGLMSAFKKIWVDAWSARMEYILNNVLLALLEYPDATLLGVNRMLSDKNYRKKVVDNVSDSSVKAFWVDEFAKYGERYMQEAGAAIQNKIGQFVSNPIIRNIIGQTKSSFDIRKMMDERKILIINLSKGQVGEDAANLIGSMLITKIYLGAMSRADVNQDELDKLPNFYFFVDEFQSFANKTFANILSEARKYKLNLTIAHQYIEQMEEEVRAAVFGNVGTMIIFRLGSYDAEIFEKEFAPNFIGDDIVNLGFAQIYLKLMIDGIGSAPFSAKTLPPITKPTISFKPEIIEMSRRQFTCAKEKVEKEISDWYKLLDQKPNNLSQVQQTNTGAIINKVPVTNQNFVKNKIKSVSLNELDKNINIKYRNKSKITQEKTQVSDRQQLKTALSNAMKKLEKETELKNSETPSPEEFRSNSVTQTRTENSPYRKMQVYSVGDEKTKPDEISSENKVNGAEIPKEVLEKMLYVKKPDEKRTN
ncbi:MAG: type IV secretion system DNA-binding domain-containing protein [Patescibacteria group bacterium]